MNNHIEVLPIEQKSIVRSSTEHEFEEKGEVASLPDSYFGVIQLGDIVYFDSWLCAKYIDSDEKERYLVKEENIRAYERQISE